MEKEQKRGSVMNGVHFTREKDRLVVCLRGDIDHHTCGPLREAIDGEIWKIRPVELVLDFSGVVFMDSAGVGLILGRYRWMKELSGVVRVTGLSRRMERMLVLSGVHKLVKVELRGLLQSREIGGENDAK